MQPETAHCRTRFRFICRFGRSALVLIAAGALLPGCGNVLYTYRANSAAMKLEEARQSGAEKTALYEYTLAREHLTKAMSEAAEADYGDAYALAQLADGFAEQAVEKARLRMRASTARPTQTPEALEASPISTAPSADSTSETGEFASKPAVATPSTPNAKVQGNLDVNVEKK
jgi:hypothetical protein